MCKCSKVRPEDVAYRAFGSQQRAYHKECGDWLSPAQDGEISAQRLGQWAKDKVTFGSYAMLPGAGVLPSSSYQCADCGAITANAMTYCPSCASSNRRPLR